MGSEVGGWLVDGHNSRLFISSFHARSEAQHRYRHTHEHTGTHLVLIGPHEKSVGAIVLDVVTQTEGARLRAVGLDES